MFKNFAKLVADTKPQTEEAQRALSKKLTHIYVIFKMLKIESDTTY